MKRTVQNASLVLALLAGAACQVTPPRQPDPPPPRPEPVKEAAPATKAWVSMSTSKGDIVIELDREHAPITVDNFLAYVKKGHYDGTIFHRVMPDFMIQGGGFDAAMRQRSTAAPIRNEASNGLSNRRGTIAMARTTMPNSATAQFFINVVDNGPKLDPGPRSAGYAVFGHVVRGMDVCDTIRMMPTRPNALGEPSDPVQPVEIIKVVEISELAGK